MASSLPDSGKIRTAVVTGRHPFDVPAFHDLFRTVLARGIPWAAGRLE